MLCVRIWPQLTSAATGGGPIVHEYIFVSKLLAASVARTQNSYCARLEAGVGLRRRARLRRRPVDRTGGSAGWSTHWNVTPVCRLAENSNVASVLTVILSGVESIDATKSPSATFQV